MIKIGGLSNIKMRVEFGNGTMRVGMAKCKEEGFIGVILVNESKKHKIGEQLQPLGTKEKPASFGDIPQPAVILNYPMTAKGSKSVQVLLECLQNVKKEIDFKVADKKRKNALNKKGTVK